MQGRLGRFSEGNAEISRLCKHLAKHEIDSCSPAIIADIVFSPQGKTANVAYRKSPFSYEIELNSGISRYSGSNKLPANELTLYVKDGHFVLWSRRLDVEVVPRLTNALNMESPSAPLYRFLGILQRGGFRYAFARPSGVVFDWRKDIPRIRYKSLILSPRSWSIDPESVSRLKSLKRAERAAMLRGILKDRGCDDQIVRYGQFDVTSHCDIRSDIQCDALIDGLQRGKYARIMEATPSFHAEPVAAALNDDYVQEFVIPFLVDRDAQLSHPTQAAVHVTSYSEINISDVVVAPFDEWLFYEIYVGESLADNLLMGRLRTLVLSLQRYGYLKSWFFVRYGDSLGPHIRLRFWCGTRENAVRANEIATLTLTSAMASCEINSYRISPYDRELRRYGGKESIQICEELFCINSEFVTKALLDRNELDGELPHWLWHLWWVNDVLEEFGIKGNDVAMFLRQRFALMRQDLVIASAASEILSETVRRNLDVVKRRLSVIEQTAINIDWLRLLLEKRRIAIKRLLSTLDKGRCNYVLPSLIHMDTNRFFNSQQRYHELVMYGVLSKYAAYRCSSK